MTINTIDTNPTHLKTCLKSIVTSKKLYKKAQYIWGPPGIGKSQIVAQIANELNYKLFDVRLTTKDSTDLTGLPYLNEETRRTIYYIPEFFPTEQDLIDEGYAGGIVFLDELSAAELRLQAASYELCLDRRVGKYILPKNVVVIAAGNRIEDGAIAYDLTAALSDRFIHYTVKANPKDFIKYAIANKFHPSVITMIKAKPEHLSKGFSDMAENDDKIHPSPRSWESVSDIMYDIEDDKVRKTIINGTVGAATSQEFFMVTQELANLLPMEEYVSIASRGDEAAVQAVLPTEVPGLYGLGYSLPAYCDTEKDFTAACFLFNVMGKMTNGLPGREIMCNSMITLFHKAQKSGGVAKARAVRRSPAYEVIREQISEFADNNRYTKDA